MVNLQVLEIRPTAAHHLPIGARVCTLWSSALAQLFPGTITTPDEPLPEGHVLVELDDGDSRLVEMSKIRMLPTDYSRVGEFNTYIRLENIADVKLFQCTTRIRLQA